MDQGRKSCDQVAFSENVFYHGLHLAAEYCYQPNRAFSQIALNRLSNE